MKYAIILSEFRYNHEENGWDQRSRKLLIFPDHEAAAEAMSQYAESQDCDYTLDINDIGYVGYIEVH